MNVQLQEKYSFQEPILNSNPAHSVISNNAQFHEVIHKKKDEPKLRWNEKAINFLSKVDAKLEEEMPNFEIQNKIDRIGLLIEKKFAPLKEFNQWLDSNGQGKWYKKLAIFLAKLPARAVRNIIRLLYNIIKGIIYTAVHPLKSLNNIAKLIINLAHELIQPETWSKIGVGMVGASFGQALIAGNPISAFGFLIGSALLFSGLTCGAIKAAIKAEKGHRLQNVKNNLLFQAKQLPEAALTGFCMGLILGGIQKAVYDHQMKTLESQIMKMQNNMPIHLLRKTIFHNTLK